MLRLHWRGILNAEGVVGDWRLYIPLELGASGHGPLGYPLGQLSGARSSAQTVDRDLAAKSAPVTLLRDPRKTNEADKGDISPAPWSQVLLLRWNRRPTRFGQVSRPRPSWDSDHFHWLPVVALDSFQ